MIDGTLSDAGDLPQEGDLVGGKYRLEELLGRGGMGVVRAATHIHLGTRVAIKFVRQRPMSVESTARLLREARVVAHMTSAHVARVLDLGTLADDAPFLVMELLEGEDLGAALRRRGPFPIAEALASVIQACDAVAEAHALGIIHRDLKPSNLFVARGPNNDRSIKVLDFGVAKLAERYASDSAELSVTRSDAIIGSPLYMAPEQATSPKAVDERADVWGLGMILWHLLAGKPAFTGETLAAVMISSATAELPALQALRPDVSPALCELLAQCLKKKPDERLPNATLLAARLRELLADDSLGVSDASSPRATAGDGEARAGIAREHAAFGVAAMLAFALVLAFGLLGQPVSVNAATTAETPRSGPASPVARELPLEPTHEIETSERLTQSTSAPLRSIPRLKVTQAVRQRQPAPAVMAPALADVATAALPPAPPPSHQLPGLLDRK